MGVLDKAVLVLSALASSPMSLNSLVERTGIARATAHRLATALEAHRLVDRDGDGRFVLGPRMAELGAAAISHRPLAEVARPALEALREASGESVQLYVPRGDVRVCIASLESPHSLRTIVPVGAALPMDRGSAARVLSGDERALRRGWAETVEEREKGVASVSAPVRAGSQVVAAVSVSGPIERTTRTPGRRYAEAVVEAAERISASLT